MIIPLLIGAVAIFIWSKLSPTMPTEKTELLESPLPESKDIMDVFKENAPKVAAIVAGGTGAVKVATTILPKATVLPKAVVSMLPTVGSVTIPVTALPAARVLPSAVMEMLPGGVEGASKIGTGVGGASGSGALATVGGAAMVVSPLIVVPFIAKTLDKLFGIGESGLHDDPELLARQLEITKEKEEMIAAAVPGGAVPSYNPKSGFWEGEGG